MTNTFNTMQNYYRQHLPQFQQQQQAYPVGTQAMGAAQRMGFLGMGQQGGQSTMPQGQSFMQYPSQAQDSMDWGRQYLDDIQRPAVAPNNQYSSPHGGYETALNTRGMSTIPPQQANPTPSSGYTPMGVGGLDSTLPQGMNTSEASTALFGTGSAPAQQSWMQSAGDYMGFDGKFGNQGSTEGFSMNGLADSLGFESMGGMINGASGLAKTYLGFKGLGIAQDQLDFTKSSWREQYDTSRKDYERDIADRDARRKAGGS